MDIYQKTTFNSYLIRKKDGYNAFVKNRIFYLFWNNKDYAGLNAVLADEINENDLEDIKKNTKDYNFSVSLKKPVHEALLSQGLHYNKTAKVMFYKAQSKLNPKTDLVIKKVETRKDLLKWASVVSDVFKLRNTEYIYNCCQGDLSLSEVTFFYGEIDGKPVAASQSVKNAEACGLYWVAVKPLFQKKGYGYDIVAAAINDALDNQLNNFTLSSSDMGYPLYKKIGFEVLYERYDYLLEK